MAVTVMSTSTLVLPLIEVLPTDLGVEVLDPPFDCSDRASVIEDGAPEIANHRVWDV